MLHRHKLIALFIIFTLCLFSTYTVASTPESKPAYSKTLEQIYKSKDVYKDTQNRLKELNTNYSSITYLFSAGKSVQNRDLFVLKVGNGNKKIFINASHHPREYMGTVLTLNQIQYLLEAYVSNGTIDGVSIKALLDNDISFYFMPLVNPDGVQICVNGSPSYYFNANKVDLNHNYDADWSKNITKYYSTGSKAFSEPETQAVKLLCETVEFDLTIAYHAAGDIIYWYYGQQGADKTRDLAYANLLKGITGYSLVSSKNYKSSTSGFKDWCIQKLKIPSFTLEIGGKQGLTKPLGWSVYTSVWQKNQLVPTRIADQLLAQENFKNDSQIALIYKDSLVHLKKSILLQQGQKYIYIEDAKSIIGSKLTAALQEKLKQSERVINKVSYINLESLSETLKLYYNYDSAVNTVYMK